jgi:acetyl esterase/lipase
MTYNPNLEAILDTPKIRELKKQDFAIQREVFGKSSIESIAQLPKVDVEETDINLDNGTRLRHYKPNQESDKALLFIHGGGWCVGSIDTYDHVCRYLCDNGKFNVFSLDYRLAPEHKFPVAVNDCFDAYDWLYANASNFGFKAENIFVMGDSAGGNFATIICHERQQNMPKAQILVYPATDMYTKYNSQVKFDEHKYHLNMKWCENFLNAYVAYAESNIETLKNPQISPIFYENIAQPDTLIIAATHDILIDSIYAYEKKLKSQNVHVEIHYDNEMFHGFIITVGLLPFKNAEVALDKAIKFINAI